MKYLKTIIVFTFLTCCTFLSKAESDDVLEIQFETNRFYSQYLFLQSLAEIPGTSPTPKFVFDQSDYAKETTIGESIEKVSQINTYYEYQFEGYPQHRHNGTQVWQLLKIAAASSTDVDDFGGRISGMLPVNDLRKILDGMRLIEKVHDELVWNPYEEQLNVYLEELRKKTKEQRLSPNFEKAAKFYGTDWNRYLPFRVMISPIPHSKEGVYELATPEGNILSYSIQIYDNRNLAGDLGVIFHELCHILYSNQSVEKQEELERNFIDHPSEYKVIAYQVLDEALATALGQGWYYKQMTDSLDQENWYAVDQVNDVAKAIYSLVEESIDVGLNKDFVDAYLEIYEKEFEQSLYEISSNIGNVNLLLDDTFSSPNELFPYFFQNFDMHSIQDFHGIDDQNMAYWGALLGAKMVIVDSNSSKYDKLKQELKWLLRNDSPTDVIFTKVFEGEQYYILVVSKLEHVNEAFKILKTKKILKPSMEKIEIF